VDPVSYKFKRLDSDVIKTLFLRLQYDDMNEKTKWIFRHRLQYDYNFMVELLSRHPRYLQDLLHCEEYAQEKKQKKKYGRIPMLRVPYKKARWLSDRLLGVVIGNSKGSLEIFREIARGSYILQTYYTALDESLFNICC